MIKKLITAIFALFYLISLSDIGKSVPKKSNRVLWEGKPQKLPYALSCRMSIIMGLMACVIPVLLLLMTWDPWDKLTPIPTKGGPVFFITGYCMFMAFLFWGLKVSIGRVIYRYWTAQDVKYIITESEVIKKTRKGTVRISLDDIRKVVISHSKIFKGVGTVSFVTDDIDDDMKQIVPVGTDYPVEVNEDNTKTFALTFYGIENPKQVRDLFCKEGKTIYVEENK